MGQKSPQNKPVVENVQNNPAQNNSISSQRIDTIDTNVKHERANSITRHRSYEEHNKKK